MAKETLSRQSRTNCWMSSGAFLLVLFLAAALAEAALPSAVTSRIRSINSGLNQIDKALDSNRLDTAQRKLKEVQRIHKEIQDRYRDKFDEGDADYKAMTDRLAAAAAKVEAAAKTMAGAAAAQKEATQANETLCKEWVGKLKPFVDHKSDLYLRIGAELNNASPEDQAKSKAAYAKAKALLEEFRTVQFSAKTMELRNMESQLESSMRYYGREEASAAQEASCQGWVDRLGPYVEVGQGSPKYLIASATANAEEAQSRQALYEEAKRVFDEYKKAEFPAGKTPRLQSIEEQMIKTLDEFPKSLAQSQALMSGSIRDRLDAVLAYFDRDVAWKSDVTKKPPTIMDRDLKPLREEVDRYAGTVKENDASLAELRNKLKTIVTRDEENRVVWAQRTYQKPDAYSGTDIGVLQKKASEVALAAYRNGTVLRVTVPTKDWQIEDVVEATDTTRTALRRRITRSVNAQAAVKDSTGKVWLQGIVLAQDKTPDGGWGTLKGHTTWADWMAAENVGKTAP